MLRRIKKISTREQMMKRSNEISILIQVNRRQLHIFLWLRGKKTERKREIEKKKKTGSNVHYFIQRFYICYVR